MAEEEKYLGYIKYEGPLVEDGMMDAKRQAEALLGFDSAIRFFIDKQAPGFRDLDFEIPVRIRKGSWEALIPDTVGGWIQAGLGTVAAAYLAKAGQKMAENDFADVGIKDLFRKSLEGIQWFVKIGKHVGDLSIKQFEKVQFRDNGELIGIENSSGEILYVPKYYLDLYSNCHPRLLEKIANNIANGRDLVVGYIDGDRVEEVEISYGEKNIFSSDTEDSDEDILFPELVHGDSVVLVGEVTRENKTSN